LGFGPKDVREIDMLGRIIKLHDDGITWEGDPRHLDTLKLYFGVDSTTKTLNRNGYDDEVDISDDEVDEMTTTETKAFRRLAATLNYMAQDNPWLQYQAKEVCRNMANPGVKDFSKIKQIVRFRMGTGKVVYKYIWQNEEEAREIMIFVDSDWAGCKRSRKSTSGGVMKIGKHVIRTWSTVATS
jgi:hypothetical protein